jgi:hypothetical protein
MNVGDAPMLLFEPDASPAACCRRRSPDFELPSATPVTLNLPASSVRPVGSHLRRYLLGERHDGAAASAVGVEDRSLRRRSAGQADDRRAVRERSDGLR